MKLTKRKILYIACAAIVIVCISVNIYRQNQWHEKHRIESQYKSVYCTEYKSELAALQSMYSNIVSDINNRNKSTQWREERLEELCRLLGFYNGYHGEYFMIDDFREYNRKYQSEDNRIMVEIAERNAKAAEQKARDSRQYEQ